MDKVSKALAITIKPSWQIANMFSGYVNKVIGNLSGSDLKARNMVVKALKNAVSICNNSINKQIRK
ncbi:MAG: hypothetical protein Q4G04_06790 [bacterium]|nr:hypothetical protein [bacterium]